MGELTVPADIRIQAAKVRKTKKYDPPNPPENRNSLATNIRKEDWGCTSYRHWYTGHVHHDRHMSSQEYSGVTVESLRTLAPKDYYAHSHGYRSDQEMKADVWHRKFGRASRSFVNLKQLWSEGGQGEPE